MSQYNLPQQALDNIIHQLQLFTDTEFIFPTIVKRIVNNAWNYRLNAMVEGMLHFDDLNVYQYLRDDYNKIVTEIKESLMRIEKNKTTAIKESSSLLAKLQVYEMIVFITQQIIDRLKQATSAKYNAQLEIEELKKKLSHTEDSQEKENINYKIELLEKKLIVKVEYVVQVYPLTSYKLQDDELSYLAQF